MTAAAAPSKPLALVTGASSGIGLELAKQFAEHGFDLVVCAEDAELDAASAQLRSLGADVRAVRTDLTRYDGVEELYAAATAEGRPLDAAVLNAGVGVGGPFTETDLGAELGIVELNVASTVHLAKRVVSDMARRGEGRVLFSSSVASKMPAPFEAVYGASKAFVQSFALALREEVADSGVSVTSLLPGPTETEFFDRAGMQDTKVGAPDASRDDAAQVARQGFDGLMGGKAQVFAGSASSRLQGAVAGKVPAAVTTKMHRSLSEPGSGE